MKTLEDLFDISKKLTFSHLKVGTGFHQLCLLAMCFSAETDAIECSHFSTDILSVKVNL